MAYNESGALPVSQSIYQLGGYTFELKVQNVHEPGEEDVVSIFAICRGPDGNRETQALDFPVGAEVESWSVEANETEASVYVTISGGEINAILTVADGEYLGREYAPEGYRCSATPHFGMKPQGTTVYLTQYNGIIYSAQCTGSNFGFVSDTSGHSSAGAWGAPNTSRYFRSTGAKSTIYGAGVPESAINPDGKSTDYIGFNGEQLVGRFAIDIREADGGPDGDWDEPGSVEPEPGELTHTLTLTAIAALSGRHNDPLNDTSYSYMPADNLTEKPYGCGGDGGYGGGGGGGASSMVVRQIVTDKASHVEYSTRTKRHGYGSGGGKGGKGGDGCILIFY